VIIVDDHAALFDGVKFRCAVGRNGRGSKRAEGDGVTPAGCHRIEAVLFRPDRIAPPRVRLGPRCALRPADGWCDAPEELQYDQPIKRPAGMSAEALWRDDALYDVVCPLVWRAAPGVGAGGSAIFLHCARADYGPTAGCVALALPDLLAILAAMTPADRVVVEG